MFSTKRFSKTSKGVVYAINQAQVILRSTSMDSNKHLADGIFVSMRKSKSLDFREVVTSHVYMSRLVGI